MQIYILTDKIIFLFFLLYKRAVQLFVSTYDLTLCKPLLYPQLMYYYIFRNIAAIPSEKCVKVSFKVMQWSLWEPFITKNKQIGVEIEWLYRSRENLSEFIQICVKSTKKWLILSLQHVNRRNFCFTQFWVLVTFCRRHHPQHHHSSRI